MSAPARPTDPTVSLDELMSYVDGRLSAGDRQRVETYLAANPEAREQVEAYRRQNAALHAAFDPVLREPIPERMRPPAGPRHPIWRLAGLAAMLVAGVAIGWLARGAWSPPRPLATFAHQAAAAHVIYTPEVRHPVEVKAEEEHLVRWLSKRLGHKLRTPNLAENGYRLMGGRLLPADQARPAAQFMYEDAKGQRLTLYVRALPTKEGDTAFRYAKEAGVDVFYWVDEQWGYALSGTVGREAMLELANVVYSELNPR